MITSEKLEAIVEILYNEGFSIEEIRDILIEHMDRLSSLHDVLLMIQEATQNVEGEFQ